ncbi:MAG: hypothetical protein JJ891_15130 [Rhizobiaceae bacterium]|nr:hypothetical protein [Rhizobiaceae bacterium]
MKIYLFILLIGVFLTGLILGAILVALNLSISPSADLLIPKKLDFSSFSGLLLGSISIIFTFFGVFVAVLAFFGFTSIRERVEEVARIEIEESAKTGKLREFMENSLKPDGSLYKSAQQTFRDTTFRGIGLAESSGFEDPKEEDKN